MIEINVLGVVYGSKLALHRMLPRHSGHVINIASLAGESYVPGAATYCASKQCGEGLQPSRRAASTAAPACMFSAVLPTFTNTELRRRDAGRKGVRNAGPRRSRPAVAELIADPRPRVRVPKVAGAMSRPRRSCRAASPRRSPQARRRGHLHHRRRSVARKAYEERVRTN